MPKYEDPIIKKYIDLIKKSNSEIKQFYQGDPIRVPNSNLPCIAISKSETRIGNFTNASDEHGMELVLSVVVDIRSDLDDQEAIVSGVAKLYNIIEGRNDNLTLKDSALLDILRTNHLVDSTYGLRTDLDSITTANYGVTLGKRAPEEWAIEAEIRFITHFTQVR